MQRVLKSCVVVLAALNLSGAPAPAESAALPAWLDEVQTYGMLPLVPDEAREMNISVNGVWAGFGGGHFILPNPPFVQRVAREFGENVERFVAESHEAGLVVVCGINGIEGMIGVREQIPNWESMACRDAAGELVLWGNPEEQCYIMCTNSQEWVDWEIGYGKKGIDAGAELILIDTPQGQAIANILRRAGYCDHCMKTFEAYLKEKYSAAELAEQFQLDSFENNEIVQRLKMPEDVQGEQGYWVNRTAANPLFREYLLCQEEASFRTRKQLADALRQHAAQTGKHIALSANTFNLSTVNPFGYWIRALMFNDMLDLFAYEQSHCPNGMPFEESRMPRGKWSPYHKLAYAANHRRNPAVVGAGALGRVMFPELAKGRTLNAWMGVQSADAYASGGAYIMYYFDAPAQAKEVMWKRTIENAGFVHRNKEYFSGSQETGAPLAVLFLFSERGRAIPAVFPSYLGLAQGMIEENHPFDVVFAGDDHFIQDKLRPESLAAYKSLFIPSPLSPTDNQRAIVRQFVERGGTMVTQEPGLFGYEGPWEKSEVKGISGLLTAGKGAVWRLEGEVSETATNDVGERFFRKYEAKDRADIGKLCEALGSRSLLPANRDGLVCGFLDLQPEHQRVAVHLVNYDVDEEKDALRPKQDIQLSLARPQFLVGAVSAQLFTATAAPLVLETVIDGDQIEVTVPALEIYGTVVVKAEENLASVHAD